MATLRCSIPEKFWKVNEKTLDTSLLLLKCPIFFWNLTRLRGAADTKKAKKWKKRAFFQFFAFFYSKIYNKNFFICRNWTF